jgi:hypothetical protein
MVVPEGGVGDLLSVVEQLDVGAAAAKAQSVVCIEALCRMDDEVISILIAGVVWRSSSGELASSSLVERPLFASPVALTSSSPASVGGRLSWLGVVAWAFPYCIGFSPDFR